MKKRIAAVIVGVTLGMTTLSGVALATSDAVRASGTEASADARYKPENPNHYVPKPNDYLDIPTPNDFLDD